MALPDIDRNRVPDASPLPRATVVDTRRLTGPSLLLDEPGAVLDVEVTGGLDVDDLVAAWRVRARRLLDEVGWGQARLGVRIHRTGVSLAFTAPFDVLYAATEVNEAILAGALRDLGVPRDERVDETDIARLEPPRQDRLEALRTAIAEESAPALRRLREEALERGVAFLMDDDEVSVGLGAGSTAAPTHDPPDPAAVDWASVHDIPVALVTGTNGKSTTVRMLAAVVRGAGRRTGVTSTDGILIDGEVIDRGDWSGPGGARRVLRDRRVEAAVLEIARGGLLRRGLPLEGADVAVVTNVAEDHLGEYGIHDLDDLAAAKLLVAKATRPGRRGDADRGGLLVLNADDPRLVAHAPSGQRIGWCSQDGDNPTVQSHLGRGGIAWVLAGDVITEVIEGRRTPIVDVTAVPATLDGAARHNVANALSAAAAARGLGVPVESVVAGLTGFHGAGDNPGRANRFRLDDVTVLVDFAHNPHGMRAITETAARLPGERLLVLFGQAGDRSDRDIRALARTVWASGPDRVLVAEIDGYRRGRSPGEVPSLIVDELRRCGAPEDRCHLVDSPIEGVREALAWSRPDDVLLLMVLEQRDAAVRLLRDRGAVPA